MTEYCSINILDKGPVHDQYGQNPSLTDQKPSWLT